VKQKNSIVQWGKGFIGLLIFIGCMAAIAKPGNAQQTAEKPPAQTTSPTPEAVTKPGGQRFVSIDFNNVDVNVFIKFISELTGINFVVDQRVRGKVTIISPSKISVDEAYKVFESVLEVHGFASVKSGEVVKILPSADARTKSIETRIRQESGAADDRVVTQLIPLKYANPEEIKRLFTPLVSKSSVILSYPANNMLIMTDIESNIKRLVRILNTIDVPGTGQNISVIPVEFADATKLVTVLGTVFKPTGKVQKGFADTPAAFVADERTNAIVLLASEADTQQIKELIKMLDKETPRGKGNINVYYLENATAEDVAAVLQDIPKATDKGGGAAGGDQGGKKTSPVVSDKVRITADKATNSLIILADKEDYEVLVDIIKKIDIPRSMVYIEALIMEVNVTKDFNLGTDWRGGDTLSFQDKDGGVATGFSGSSAFGGDASTIPIINPETGTAVANPLPAGFSLGVFADAINIGGIPFPSLSAVVAAYKKDKDTNILSTPQILTTDNEEAKIVVGKNIPFQTAATTTTSSDTYNSFEYKDVGKTLTITPHISKDRLVRLKIALEVTSLENANENKPTTLKRTVDTTVIVKDKNTIVIGGLIDDIIDNSQWKVPCLGDIPILGWAFKSESKKNEKSNLYVFLTPKVVNTPFEAGTVYKEKKEQIDNIKSGSIKLYRGSGKDAEKTTIPGPAVENFTQQQNVQPPPAPAEGEKPNE
jgi:general secretion pathway protein D